MVKILLPKQHGAWAMLVIPFWLGVVASSFVWQHIPFFLGWFFLYLCTYPMLFLFKGKKRSFYIKWTLIYLVFALIFLIIPLWLRPSLVLFGLAVMPFFLINIYFSWKKSDRAFMNDLSAVFSFAIGGLASSYLPSAEINSAAILMFVASILFFIGCTFFVKTMVREKKNVFYKYLSWGYHIIVFFGGVFVGYYIVAIAFLPSLFRAFYFYGKPLTPKKVGILEIVNTVLFLIGMVISVNI